MKVSKNLKYQTHKKSFKTLSKNPNDQNGAKGAKRGDPIGFFNIHCCKTAKKIEGGTLWGKKSKKSLAVLKKMKGEPLVSPGTVCYKEKRKTFLVQFARPNS